MLLFDVVGWFNLVQFSLVHDTVYKNNLKKNSIIIKNNLNKKRKERRKSRKKERRKKEREKERKKEKKEEPKFNLI